MTQIKYIGLDLETTGLDPDVGGILEIAMTALDADLNEIDHFTSPVYSTYADYHRYTFMDEVVVDMHQESGLWEDIDAHLEARDGVDILPEVVEKRALKWLNTLDMPAGHKPMMVGNSITFDRTFLAEEMPKLLNRFSHRSLDATSVIEAAALTGADPAAIRERAGAGIVKHRALDDLRAARLQIKTAIAAIQGADPTTTTQ